MKTKVQVKDLRKGDVLSSGAIMLSDPLVGIWTPKDKYEINVRYPDGKEKKQLWGRYTTVTVLNR